MKKFLWGIVGIFVLLGGVFLGACGKQVSLSVATQDVVIYTNDSQEGQSYKEVEVSLDGSDLGINVELLEGDNCVEIQKTNTASRKANGKYAFVIATKEDLNSGFAKVKVSAVEDSKENKIINVTVNTVLDAILTANDDQESEGSNLYVVKEVAKKLSLEEYFDFRPTTANVKDVDWTFTTSKGKEYTIDDDVLAKIEGDELIVYDGFNSNNIELKASFVKNPQISNTITLAVLENITVKGLVVDGDELYRNGEVVTDEKELNLKRNNEEFGVVSGKIIVNSQYDVIPSIEVYNHATGELLEQSVATRYINFEVPTTSTETTTKTYNFTLDAQVQSSADEGLTGEFDVYFVVKYLDYNYKMKIDGSYVALKVEYMATDIDMYNSENRAINNAAIDVFSSYKNTYGYAITTYVSPENVTLDNSYFRFAIDVNQSAFRENPLPPANPIDNVAKFYYRGRYLRFQRLSGSSVYTSETLLTGTQVYVIAASTYENVTFSVQALSNTDVSTNVYMNFYEITTDADLDIKNADGEETEDLVYLSSSVSAEKKITYEIKVLGVNSLTGLSLKHDQNSKFAFSGMTLIGVTNDETEKSVSVRFDVELTSYNFEDAIEFWFEHITGRVSKKLKIQTFVPIETAYVQNASQSLADVYTAQNADQNFALTELGVVDTEFASTSLSKLMVEVGATISLHTSVQNATLNENGISYAYLRFESFEEDYTGDDAQAVFDEMDFEEIKPYASSFGEVDTTLFAINAQTLQIFDNEFKGFVCVLFGGYDEEHNEVTFVRIFALEAVYSVRYMMSNVTTKLLYTTETLSEQEMNRSYVDVTISLRPDKKVPTYSKNFEKLSFTSAIEDWTAASSMDTFLENRYYLVSAIDFANHGHDIVFRITAKSTNLQTVVHDVLKIAYVDGNGVEKNAEIQLEIRNVKRIENVNWINRTIDDTIYLNLTSQSESDKNFTISTSVLPSDANDISLRHRYFSIGGSGADLDTTTSAVGQTVNININTDNGGYGFIYLLPTDMVKVVDGTEKLLLYSYRDADGNLVGENDEIVEEIPYYGVSVDDLNLRYGDIINGYKDLEHDENSISPFFLNNEGKRIYYKDLILRIYVKIADGQSSETAINIYNQTNLRQIDTALHYVLMNDIALENWTAFDGFSGELEGNGHALIFGGDNCQNFTSALYGKLSGITFSGKVQNCSGFIASEIQQTGIIENCTIDVAYANGKYGPSVLTSNAAAVVGAVAGLNNRGAIRNTKVYGLSIQAATANVGGIVGSNHGTIEDCGFEFYKFEGETAGSTAVNQITANQFGGLVGELASDGKIYRSYVYNFSGEDVVPAASYAFAISMQSGGGSDTKIQESFVYLGDISAMNSEMSGTITLRNNYIAYDNVDHVEVRLYYNGTTKTLTDPEADISDLDAAVWQKTDIDEHVNFGYTYLKNVMPSATLDLASVELNAESTKFVKADATSGVLMVYKTTTNVSGRERAELDTLNTISIAELFGLTKLQAKSLLLTSNCSDVLISADSIKVLNRNISEFTITAHIKMDYSQSKDFKFIIVNALPVLTTSVSGITLLDDEILLLQTTTARSVLFSTQNRVVLAGQVYALEKDQYSIGYEISPDGDEHVSTSISGNSLILRGEHAHTGNEMTRVSAYLTISGIAEKYQNALNLERNFDVSVYSGATSLVILDASDLQISASKHATFEVEVVSDSAEEDLVLTLRYGEIEVAGERKVNSVSFEVDEKLKINMNWTKTQISANEFRFRVVVKIDNDHLHLIDRVYDNLTIFVNAASQRTSSDYEKPIALTVETRSVEDLSLTVYAIEGRQIKNSTLYMLRSNSLLTTLAPSSDAILAVSLDPAYAKMSHFTLTYSASGDGKYGVVTMSRLAFNERFGYYAVSTVLSIENGVRVNLTEEDKTGDGIFYFRLYVSNGFAGKVSLKLTVTVYDEDEVSLYGSHDVLVSALHEATVRVGGKTTYLLAKGESADVTVELEPGQALYDLYLENNYESISLSTPYFDEESGLYKSTLSAGIDARVRVADGDAGSGIFYVVAAVSRVINGVQEIKTARVTVALVDFSVDLEGTTVFGSTKQLNYNGRNYDAIYAYIDESKDVAFDYHILPEDYNYDKNDQEQINLVEEILAKRNVFEMQNVYKDENAGYYINYVYNEDRGFFEKIELKEQLWYASGSGVLSKVYNSNYDSILPNNYFSIDFTNGFKIIGKNSGTQLMMLRTIIYYQGIEFQYDYYFLIRVDVWTDEEAPLAISSAEEFIQRATEGDTPADYILTSDIVLENYTPVNSELFNSFDGNGYTIFINSFNIPDDSTILRLGLFDTVASNSTIKNVKVNIYNGGQITVNASAISGFTDVKIAGFAVTNNGVIYNSEVVAYYDEENCASSLSGEVGLVVKYTDGQNTAPIRLPSMVGIDSVVAGFVYENNSSGSIANCRVGGSVLNHITEVAGTKYLEEIELDIFTIEGQGEVSGFVAKNGGNISASFAKQVQIYNNMDSNATKTAGFVLSNSGNLQNDYVEGLGDREKIDEATGEIFPSFDVTNISAMGVIAGFVYDNSGVVRNSYANIAIDNEKTKSTMASGFVYINQTAGQISLCYTACAISKTSLGQMNFTGVDELENSLNFGNIKLSYFYHDTKLDTTNENKFNTGAIGINDVFDAGTFYGFSFSSTEGAYDGIWEMTDMGVSLVSANQIAISNRYVAQVGDTSMKSVFYNKQIRRLSNFEILDISYGSLLNPIIIRNAADFAKATGKATAKEISSYKEYYTNTTVTGTYRLVCAIDMNEIAQNSDDDNAVKLTTTSKTFSGLLDGNGFEIANIGLGSNRTLENFGLFAKLENAVVMNVNLIVTSVHDTEANIVGVLAGTALDSRILAIDLSPASGSEGQGQTAVQGGNIVGGVVGLVIGSSYVSDININSIYVESVYYDARKTIKSNDEDVQQMRESYKGGASIDVRRLSYAGAAFGFVDIFSEYSPDFTSFNQSYTVLDFNVVSVHVQQSVNIYAEVAGGVFGYLGRNTMAYDAVIELDADMALSNPSYIISRNLYAGGIVGECYGGLHAVKASYADELQKTIEANEIAYYNGSTNVERGQQTIFSYTEDDEGYIERTNNPLFIGGVAGYMGGGFMYVGYSKLNVVAHGDRIVGAGGVVGLLGRSTNFYKLSFLNGAKNTNFLFYDVYASGDVYADNNLAIAGGIIGMMLEEIGTSDVAFKDVVAVNAYSHDGENIKGKNHAMLIGGVGRLDGNNITINSASAYNLSSNLYLISSYNDVKVNARNGEISATAGSLTVGGYWKYGNDTARYTFDGNEKIAVFGFNTRIDSDANRELYILELDEIAGFENMEYAYSRMYSYFLANGWEESFWKHDQGRLFPEIELLPKARIVYWDQWNTTTVFELMNGSSTTIVIRGKAKDSEEIYDIDLRAGSEIASELQGKGVATTIESFKGKLYSYAKYMNTLEGGQITRNIYPGVGGEIGQGAGLILDAPLFDVVTGNSIVDGVTCYLCGTTGSDGTLVRQGFINRVEDSMVRGVTIVANDNVTLTAQSDGTNDYGRENFSAGLIANVARSSSIMECKVLFRREENPVIKLVANNKIDGADKTAYNNYLGVFVGLFRQNSAFSSISLQNLSVGMLNKNSEIKDVDINVSMIGSTSENTALHVGIYAGQVQKSEASYAKTVLNLQQYEMNYNIYLQGDNAAQDTYVGGYVGRIDTINDVVFTAAKVARDDVGIVKIHQQANLKNIYAGCVIGEMKTVTTIMEGNDVCVRGALNFDCVEKAIAGKVNVGGFIGSSYATLTISKFDFDVDIVANNLAGGEDVSFGGIIGSVNSEKVTIANCSTVAVSMDIDSLGTVAIGGMIGKMKSFVTLSGNMLVKDRKEIHGNVEVDVGIEATVRKTTEPYNEYAYVGGLIGWIKESGNGTAGELINFSLEISNAGYITNLNTFNVVADNLMFGGAVGYVDATITQKIAVQNCVFGGKVDVNVEGNTRTAVVGGIVGAYETAHNNLNESTSQFAVTNSFAYGDIFVEYSNAQSLLTSYEFGGIVGRTTKVAVSDCYSLLTNFNGRTPYQNGERKIYYVGAIVGTNAEIAEYSNNSYSSGVVLAYQKEGAEDNLDLEYTKTTTGEYYGYSNKENLKNNTKRTVGILTNISKFLTSGNAFASGEKLNPVEYSNSAQEITGSGQTHGIKWITMVADVGKEGVAFGSAQDYAFVGNGHTFTRSSQENATAHFNGGFTNNAINSAKGSIISNLIVNLNVEENLAETSENYFGGVVGIIDEKTHIYGVGVNGTLSVGREGTGNQNIEIGGLVGSTTGGLIENCYVDATLIYRGGEGGQISGIANINKVDVTTIANCYTSGMIVPYFGCKAYAYANIADDTSYVMYDCYSITQFDDSKIFGGEVTGKDLKNNVTAVYEDNISTAMSPLDFDDDATAEELWIQDAKVNYGYGVQPFGFLRIAEIKVFTRNSPTPDGATGRVSYTYTTAGIGDIDSANIYEILNKDKFVQMIDKQEGNYFLRYDIDLQSLAATKIGKNVSLTLDGQENTLKNYSGSQGLFGTVSGSIINLRMTEINMTTTNVATVGSLANILTGKLNNITVQGQISNNSGNATVVGGVVGEMSGNNNVQAKLIESVVNITNANKGITGGIVGKMLKGNIAYASSNGIINNKTNITTAIDNVSHAYALKDSVDPTSITGGIAGVMADGQISQAYNSNSVIGNYTVETNVNAVVGGIVGYLKAGEISYAYNVGFVGAGNYEATSSVAYAGGIFGYGVAGRVSDCMNDAAVQALSDVDGTDQSIAVTRTSNMTTESWDNRSNENVSTLTNNPTDLTFNVTLTYNSSRHTRQVYAHGLGTASDSNISVAWNTNNTSRDNIKNDGNVGQKVDTQVMTFDRYAMLDNDEKFASGSTAKNGVDLPNYVEGDYSFWATYQFANEGNKTAGDYQYTVNGQDSYGFTSRIYMVDSIVGRQYGNGENDVYNAIKNYRAGNVESGAWSQVRQRLYNIMTRDGGIEQFITANDEIRPEQTLDEYVDAYKRQQTINYQSQYHGATPPQNLIDSWTNYATNQYHSLYDALGTMWSKMADASFLKGSAPVKYASSVEFSGYEHFIQQENENGYSSDSKQYGEINVDTLNSRINGINAFFEHSEQQRSVIVNGQNTAIVYSNDDFKAAMAPDIASFEISVNVGTGVAIEDINAKLEGEYQFTENVEKRLSAEGVFTISGNAQYADLTHSSPNIELTLSFSKTIEKQMSKNNVTTADGKTRIVLEDENGTLSLEDATTIKTATPTTDEGSIRYTGNYKIYIENAKTSSHSDGNEVSGELKTDAAIPYIEINSELSNLNGKYLYIVAEVENLIIQEVSADYSSTSGTAEFTMSNYNDITKDAVIGYDGFVVSDRLTSAQIAGIETTLGTVDLEELRQVLVDYGYDYSHDGRVVLGQTRTGYGAIHEIVYERNINSGNYEWANKIPGAGADQVDANANTLTYTPSSGDTFSDWTVYFDKDVTGNLSAAALSGISINPVTIGPFELTISNISAASYASKEVDSVGQSWLGYDFYKYDVHYTVSNADVQVTTKSNFVGYTLRKSSNVRDIKQKLIETAGGVAYSSSGTYPGTETLTFDYEINTNTKAANMPLSLISGEAIRLSDDVSVTIAAGTKESGDAYFANMPYTLTRYEERATNYLSTYNYSYEYSLFENGYEVLYSDGVGYINKNGTFYKGEAIYQQTSDTEVQEGKRYYTRSGVINYQYNLVTDIPAGTNPSAEEYYEFVETRYVVDNTVTYEETMSHTFLIGNNKTISVGYIAKSYGGTDNTDNFAFIKNISTSALQIYKKVGVWVAGQQEYPVRKIYQGNVFSFALPNSGNATGEIVGYAPNIEGLTLTPAADDTKTGATYNEYGLTTFNFDVTYSAQENGTAIEQELSNFKMTNIMFGSDLYLKTTLGDNSINIQGAGNVVKFVGGVKDGKRAGFFTNNSGNLMNMYVVGMSSVDGIGRNQKATLFVENNHAKISNVIVYGTLRNGYSQYSNKKINLLFNTVSNSNQLNNVKGFVTANSLDAKKRGESVKVAITEKVGIFGTLNYVDNIINTNILIAGDGQNGENGNSDGHNGGNGANGGRAGAIETATNSSSYYKEGIGGIGGYGADGKNGHYVSGNVLARGIGGNAGANAGNTRIEDLPTYNGLNGAGGFGRIYAAGTNGTMIMRSENSDMKATNWKATLLTQGKDGNNKDVNIFAEVYGITNRTWKIFANRRYGVMERNWIGWQEVKEDKWKENVSDNKPGSSYFNNKTYYFVNDERFDTGWWDGYIETYNILFPSGELINDTISFVNTNS